MSDYDIIVQMLKRETPDRMPTEAEIRRMSDETYSTEENHNYYEVVCDGETMTMFAGEFPDGNSCHAVTCFPDQYDYRYFTVATGKYGLSYEEMLQRTKFACIADETLRWIRDHGIDQDMDIMARVELLLDHLWEQLDDRLLAARDLEYDCFGNPLGD